MEPVITSAAVTFLGSTAFRLAISASLARWKARQEHKFELERMKLQDEIEGHTHRRNLEALKVQSDLGVLEAAVEKQHDLQLLDDQRFDNAMLEVRSPSGYPFLDRWNSFIRPALATTCLVVWVFSLAARSWIPTPWDLELMAATLGIFIGGRIHSTGR